MEDGTILTGLAAAPIITAVVQAISVAFPSIPRRLFPLVSMLAGVLWNVAVAFDAGELGVTTVLFGIVVGLSASGLYSVARPVVEAAAAANRN